MKLQLSRVDSSTSHVYIYFQFASSSLMNHASATSIFPKPFRFPLVPRMPVAPSRPTASSFAHIGAFDSMNQSIYRVDGSRPKFTRNQSFTCPGAF